MADMDASNMPGGGQRKEIYTYAAPWTVFAMAWSHRCVLLLAFSFVKSDSDFRHVYVHFDNYALVL